MKRNVLKSIGIAIALATALSTVQSQSFNIDLDVRSGDPRLGDGVPSSSFGAAAGQIGHWTRYPAISQGPHELEDILGNLTGVTLAITTGQGFAGAWANKTNTGDFALLLNDVTVMGNGRLTFRFNGLSDGEYEVITYAVDPLGEFVPASVFIPQALSNQNQLVTGPMPGNSFALGITHSRHFAAIAGGVFEIEVAGPEPFVKVNGFQITAVSEPPSLYLIVAGLALTLLLRRRVSI